MLRITIDCDVSRCGGTVSFEPAGARSKSGRILGACDRCGAVHCLYGGEVRRVVARDDDTTAISSRPLARPGGANVEAAGAA